jgi:flagellar M-ring protein FliF
LIDFRKVETTEERFDPNGQVVRSEQREQERSSGVNGQSGGVPGVQSNVPPGTEGEPSLTSSTSSQNKNETVNYEISRTVSRIVEPIGLVKKLSVAVLVDGTYEIPKGADGETPAAKKYIPRTAEDMQRLEEIVKKAMGFSEERQDQVQVVNVQFDVAPDEGQGGESEPAPASARTWAPYIRYGVGAALFGLLLLFVVRPLLTMLAAASGSTGTGQTPAALPPTVTAAETPLVGRPRAQLIEAARGNPETTAVVVKQWLKSGSGA